MKIKKLITKKPFTPKERSAYEVEFEIGTTTRALSLITESMRRHGVECPFLEQLESIDSFLMEVRQNCQSNLVKNPVPNELLKLVHKKCRGLDSTIKEICKIDETKGTEKKNKE